MRPSARWASSRGVRFRVEHDLSAPLASVEEALASPRWGAVLREHHPRLASVELTELRREGRVLTRVLRVRGKPPSFVPKAALPADALEWEERFVYDLDTHTALFEALPAPAYRQRVTCKAAYALASTGTHTCRRSATGDIEVRAGWMSTMLARFATAEVRTTYDAEAAALERLALDAQPFTP